MVLVFLYNGTHRFVNNDSVIYESEGKQIWNICENVG
jgi:hypothetical protein